MVGVGHEVSPGANFPAEAEKNPPMILPWGKKADFRTGAKVIHKKESLGKGSGNPEYFRMGEDPEASAEDELRRGHTRGRLERAVEPLADLPVIVRILPVGGDPNVDVDKDQRLSMASRRAAEECRSTPGRVPFPRKVRRGRPEVDRDLGWASKRRRKASATVSPRVIERRAETSLALRKRGSGMETVVRMHQSVHKMHKNAI